MTSESDHLTPMTENTSEAPMEASKALFTSPATPEQAHISKSRALDGPVYTNDDDPSTASTMQTTPAAADTTINNWSDSDPIRMLDIEYSQSSLASAHHQDEAFLVDAAVSVELSKTAALEEEITNLRLELARQSTEYTQALDAEHAWCQATVQQASDVACILRDANIQLTSEMDQLRARVVQLEFEASEQLKTSVNEDEQQGNEQLIAALQVEIGDLERQVHKAHRAKVAAAETEEAALQRAEILAQQVEQMVNLLEEERVEKEKLIEALKAASVLPQ